MAEGPALLDAFLCPLTLEPMQDPVTAAQLRGSAAQAAPAAPLAPAVYAAVPDAFLCPLTLDLMLDPVVTCDGQTYERGAIEQWLRQSSTSPLTGQQLPHLGLAPNVVLRGLIRDVLEVRHQSSGEGSGEGSGGGLKPGLCAAHCY